MTVPSRSAVGRGGRRWLRPSRLLRTPSGLWLVEDVQPVAAFLDTTSAVGTGGTPRLVDWAGTPPAPAGSSRVAVADGAGFAVQDGAGAPVVRVAADGGVRVHQAPGLTLRAAHRGDLWLTGGGTVVVPRGVLGEPFPPPLSLGEGLVVGIRPDGSRRELTVDHPVVTVAPQPRGLAVTVSEQPVSIDGPGHTSHTYPTSTVLVSWDDRSPRPRIADLPAVPAPQLPTRLWRWHSDDPDFLRAHAVDRLGLLWSAGWRRTGSAPDRPLLLTGHDPVTLEKRVRVDLGIGDVLDLAVVDPEVWVAVRRGRAVDLVQPVQVIAVTAAASMRVVLDADTIDITDSCRALITQDEDTRTAFPLRQRDQYGDLQAYWTHADGNVTPLAEGMTDALVAVAGSWPDTVLEFSCRHPSRPGLLLRRRVPLFDELGRPTELPYSAIHLMEALATGRLPPVDDADDGIVDI